MNAVLGGLRQKIGEFDGKATTLLGEAEAAFSEDEGYLDTLIALLSERQDHLASGASWLIKSAIERGDDITEDQVISLVGRLSDVEDWSAQLHLCQVLRRLTVPCQVAGDLADWLMGLLDHERPFVRAWSLDALGAVALVHMTYAQRFNAALDLAKQDEAASVRARARNLAAV